MLGPDNNNIDIEDICDTEGIYLTNEVDGLRVLTTGYTYFLEKVSEETKNVFELTSIDPGAKLRYAKRAIDEEEPEAFQLIRELEDQLSEGIRKLLMAA